MNEPTFDLKETIMIFRHWAWLLLLGSLLGGMGGYFGSRLQEPIYQASTHALIMRAPQEKSLDLDYFSDQQLVQTYAQLLNTQPVRDGASDRLAYQIEKNQVKVEQTRDSQIIQVIIEDQNPQHAADIANVLVEVLIELNQSIQASRYVATEASLQAQIAQVETQVNIIQHDVNKLSTQSLQDQLNEVEVQIKPLQEEVSTLQKEIAALEPAWSVERKTQIAEKKARIAQIQPLLNVYQQIYSNLFALGRPVESNSNTSSRLAQLESTLDLYQKLYINLLTSLETVRLAHLQNTPNIVQIKPAALPEKPIRPRTVVNTALAAMLGLVLAAGNIYLIEYLDDTLKTPNDVENALGLPVLGFVAEMKYKDKNAKAFYISKQPHSPVAEAFRVLRNNLEFESEQEPIHTLLVTSPGLAEGKSTVAVNLATILAISGKQVAIVDADMHRPQIHQFFGIPNIEGFSNLFHDPGLVHSLSQNKTDLPYLKVITSGNLSTSATELWQSKKLDRILTELRTLAEMVVIDGPPSLMSDTQILAGKVDAVLLVIRPGKTTSKNAKASMEMFKRLGVRVIGTVMNRIPRNRSIYYGGYEFYSPYSKTKSYFSRKISQPEQEYIEETERIKRQSLRKNIFLDRTAGFSTDPEELPPPDPPKN